MTKLARAGKAVWAFLGTLVGATTVAVANLPGGHQHISEISDLGWLGVAVTVLGVSGGVYAIKNQPAPAEADATPAVPAAGAKKTKETKKTATKT